MEGEGHYTNLTAISNFQRFHMTETIIQFHSYNDFAFSHDQGHDTNLTAVSEFVFSHDQDHNTISHYK